MPVSMPTPAMVPIMPVMVPVCGFYSLSASPTGIAYATIPPTPFKYVLLSTSASELGALLGTRLSSLLGWLGVEMLWSGKAKSNIDVKQLAIFGSQPNQFQCQSQKAITATPTAQASMVGAVSVASPTVSNPTVASPTGSTTVAYYPTLPTFLASDWTQIQPIGENSDDEAWLYSNDEYFDDDDDEDDDVDDDDESDEEASAVVSYNFESNQ